MQLEIATVEDLVQVLDAHPQWREALRERLLTRELLDLPQQLAEFAAATDRRFESLEGRIGSVERQLAEFIAATDRRFESLEGRIGSVERQLAEFIAATDRRFESLERQLHQLRTDVAPLKAAHAKTCASGEADLIAEEQGLSLLAVVDRQELGALVRSSDTDGIPRHELRSFRLADIVLRAADAAGTECYVAVEVSYTANGRDTERALRHARFLTRFTGRRAHAVVAGLRFDERIRAAVEAGEVAWYQLDPKVMEVD